MKNSITLSAFILCLVFGAYAGSISKEFHKELSFKGDQVSIENVNGKIVLEAWGKDKVEISADIKVRASDKREAEKYLEKVEIVIRKSGNEMSIRVDKPDMNGGNFMDWMFGAGKPQCTVDFWIKIPYDVNIAATSVNGSIEALDIRGRSELNTTNGRISAENMQGPVDAGTTNGGIYIEITDKKLRHDMDIHTVNGGIKVSLPRDVEADLELSTVNGGINSDFPIEIEGKWGPKNASGKLNGGGRNIDMSTVNGGITIVEN